jgi:exonuclease III
MKMLTEWAYDYNINILGLVETNITDKEGKFQTLNDMKYRSFWSNANPLKRKGSGVGLLIDQTWEKHLGQIERINEYMLIASLLFRQVELEIIVVYFPPNDKEEKRKLQKTIIERYIKRSQRTQMLILGDFNSISNPELDKSHYQNTSSVKPSPIINWLKKQEFVDTFRTINPRSKEYSWTNGEVSTRIDYIWISEDLSYGLIESELHEMDIYTCSDHKVVMAEIELNHLLSVASVADIKRFQNTRTIFLYEDASEENWENYRKELDKRLIKTKEIDRNEEENEEKIDKIWDSISTGVLEAARLHIPKKKILNTENNKRKKAKKSKLSKCLLQLSK